MLLRRAGAVSLQLSTWKAVGRYSRSLRQSRLYVCREFTFSQLPDHLVLRIFRDVEAIPKVAAGQGGSGGPLYQDVSDDTLTVLTDGYQKRCGLPQVCKRWDKLLSQPSFVWAYLSVGFHELWDVQQAS